MKQIQNPKKKQDYFTNAFDKLYLNSNIEFLNQKPIMSTQDLQNLYVRALQNEKRGIRQLELTDKEMEQGAINAAIQTMSDRGFNQVPTYKGAIVLPEITITPNDSYMYDPALNAKIRRRLCYGGKLGL